MFEEKQSALAARQSVAQQALAGRINWAKISNEVSLVLPSDVWATAIMANQDTGMTFTLVARDAGDAPDVGQKSVARTMVRLNDLDSLNDVWLTQSARSQPDAEQTERQIQFQLSARVAQPASASAAPASSVPAPNGQ